MFQEEILGNISIDSTENAWVYGTYELYKSAEKFAKLFQALVSEKEEDVFDENDFDKEWIEEDNWFINDNGKVLGITIPAIYTDNQLISFRFR